MTRRLIAAAALAVVGIGAATAFQIAARERGYREFLSRGDTAVRSADTLAAIEAYSGAIALHPESVLAHLRRGETYQSRGDLDAATRDFRKASVLDPLATRPLEALGDALYQRGWFAQAAETYQARLALDDAAPIAWYRLGLALYQAGDLELVATAVTRSLALNDRSPEAYFLLGLSLQDEGKNAAAVEAFDQVLTLSPGLIAAREELADLFAALGRHAEELEQLQVIAGLSGTRAEPQVAVGLAHARASRRARSEAARQRQADLAVLTLTAALDRNTEAAPIYGALGQVWLDIASRDDDPVALEQAIEAFERSTAGGTASSRVQAQYGRALRLNGQPAEAERVLERAVLAYPIDPSALLDYAAVAEERGHFEAARTALVNHSALMPGDPNAAGRLDAVARLSDRIAQSTR